MLHIEHVQKRFGSKTVLRDVTLTVKAGQLYGLIGQNGAGKTTLMKMILGLIPIDQGSIQVAGIPVTYGQNQTNTKIGYLADVPEFYNYMSAREYLQLCAEVTNMERGMIANRIAEVLQLVGLADTKQRIQGYSRGMKQRLGVAQALLNRPQLLICDEPTSALDPKGRKEILQVFELIKAETTIILSTHILSDVERVCDRVGFLHNGQIVREGSVEELRHAQHPTGFQLTFASSQAAAQFMALAGRGKQQANSVIDEQGGEAEMIQALALCAQAQLVPEQFERLQTSLEAIFLEVIAE